MSPVMALRDAWGHADEEGTGDAAVRRLADPDHEPCDVVVTDLRLPGADGLAVLEAARARDERTRVLLLTAFGMLIAIARVSRSPWLMPVRITAIVYTDVVRGIPTILLVLLLGFGMPSLALQGLPISPFFWATVALIISYSAYVAEVFRSGIESVHPSQWASAQSLGLSRGQTLRHVVVPQGVRRVVPPLLNDFIGLQKDTVLVSYIGVVEIFRTAYIKQAAHFNMTPYVATALVFIVVTLPLARFTDWLLARSRGFGLER